VAWCVCGVREAIIKDAGKVSRMMTTTVNVIMARFGKFRSEQWVSCQCGYLPRDIVVRPQWLHRVAGSPFGFRAQIPDNLEMNDRPPTPVIFFINKLSGGQKGQQIYRMLLHLLNPRQVFLLEDDSTIMQALDIYSSLVNARICICGGDGTVGWVLSRLTDAFPPLKNPPASICPLGTGNDLSRVLGWGYQYGSRRLLRTLTEIPHARPVPLDRWQIQIEPLETNASSNESTNTRRRFFTFMDQPKFIRNANQSLYDNHRIPIRTFFFNYISFGLDAAVVLDFHVRRTRDASRYTSPLKNKILYINEARKYFNEFAFGMAWNLSSYIRLICDGQDLTDSIRHCHSLVVLNTRSFGSGTHPWGRTSTNSISPQSTGRKDDDSSDQISTPSLQASDSPINARSVNQTTTNVGDIAHATVDHFEAQDFGDRRIEVLGLNTTQMAFIHLGLRGNRIAQCSQLRIELSQPMPVHMDGEPFCLAGSSAVNITHAGQVMVLSNENR
jgi:diacylglycerol kinase (ATP)